MATGRSLAPVLQHCPRRSGRQFVQISPLFQQLQLTQRPLPLHRQHTGMLRGWQGKREARIRQLGVSPNRALVHVRHLESLALNADIILDLSVVNSLIIYNWVLMEQQKKPVSDNRFRDSLILQLIGKYCAVPSND